MGRPEGALKYICLSPLRLLNRRSGTQPLSASQAATFLRSLDRHAKSMSWPARNRGGKPGQSTRTASPPSNLRPSPVAAAPRARVSASGRGSSGDTAAASDSVIHREYATYARSAPLTATGPAEPTLVGPLQLTQRRPVPILGACPGARLRLAQPINRPSAYSPCWPVSRTGALKSA